MVKRYITQGNLLMEVNRADGGCWVNLVAPTLEECVQIAQEFQIDLADVRAALDDEESSRVDVSNKIPYFISTFRLWNTVISGKRITTIPLGSDLGERCAADCMCGSNAGSEKFSGKYGQGVQH